jgi:hypothetical protein
MSICRGIGVAIVWRAAAFIACGPIARVPRELRQGDLMIVLGVILLLIGWLTGISILYTVGSILLVVGLVLLLLGAVGRGVGGRKWYF